MPHSNNAKNGVKTVIQTQIDQNQLLTSDGISIIKLWEILFENTSEGVMITDKNYKIIKINHGFTSITGYKFNEIQGQTFSTLHSKRHDKDFYKSIKNCLKDKGKWQGEIWNRRKNGEIYPQWLTIIDIERKNEFYIGIFSDITNYVNHNINVHNHAYYDTLTNLPNRILLHDRLSFMLKHAKRKKQIMAILLLDLNRFKFINDTLGYSVGDLLLQTVGARLKSCLREVDAVFRLGDDEFAIILEEIIQPQDAAKVAKGYWQSVQPHFRFMNMSFT